MIMGTSLPAAVLVALGMISPALPAPEQQAVQLDAPLYAAPTRIDRIGRILAPVMINGQGPFRLTVDTGANQSVITTSLAAALGLTASDTVVKLNGVTGSLIVPTVRIDRFETGDLVQNALLLPLLDSVMGEADGILGMQGLEGKRITVDFHRNRIAIAWSRNERAARRFVTVPAKLRFGHLLMADGEVAGVKVHVVIDTGAERTLGNMALYKALVRRHRTKHRTVATPVIGLTLIEQMGTSVRTPVIQLADVVIKDVTVIYGDIHVFTLWDLEETPALLLGMDVLGTLKTLIIDYRRKELQLLP